MSSSTKQMEWTIVKYLNGNAYYLCDMSDWQNPESANLSIIHLTSCVEFNGNRNTMKLVALSDVPISILFDAYYFNTFFREHLTQIGIRGKDLISEKELHSLNSSLAYDLFNINTDKLHNELKEDNLNLRKQLQEVASLKRYYKDKLVKAEFTRELYKNKVKSLQAILSNEHNNMSLPEPPSSFIYNKNNSQTQNTKEMNLTNVIPNFKFGKLDYPTSSDIALSMAGIAFRKKVTGQPDTFVVLNQETKQLIEVGDLKFDVDFYQLPVQTLNPGDITIIDGHFYIVEKQNSDGSLGLIHPTTGTRSTKLARTNIFNMYFYTKIVSMFDFMGGLFNQPGQASQNNNVFGTMNPMMFMMMGDKGGDMSSMMEMMMMAQLAGGNNVFNFGQQNLPPKKTPIKKNTVAKPTTKKAASK